MKRPLVAAEPVSAYDAKTHLPSLLARAERGERFLITRHGKPIALLIPFVRDDEEQIEQVVARVRTLRSRLFRQGVTLADVLKDGETARGLAHAGHRY